MEIIPALLISVFFLNILLGLFVWFSNQRARLNNLFFLLTFSVALWILGTFFLHASEFFTNQKMFGLRMSFFGASLIPVFFFFITLIFPKEKGNLLTVLVMLVGSIGFTFSFLSISGDLIVKSVIKLTTIGVQVVYGSLYIPFAVFFITTSILSLYTLFRKYLRYTGIEKKQTGYFFMGAFLAIILGAATNLIAPVLTKKTEFSALGGLFTVFLIVPVFYSITRHGLFKTKVIATEIFVFALWVILFVRTITADTTQDFLISGALLLATVFIGVFLIQSVLKEIQQREKLEKLTTELGKVNTKLKDLNLNLQERVKEQTVEIRKAYEVEKSARKKLQSLDKTKSEFISVAAHQLRTPLSGIKWALQTSLEENECKGETNSLLSKARDATVSLITIVHDLLNVSQIEGGGMGYVIEENDLVSTAKEAIKASRLLAEKKHITLTLKTKTESIPKFSFDQEKIIIVLKNVINNAIDYTKGGGEVSVVLSWEGDRAVITVTDQGIGMTEEDKKQLFTKFYRSKEARLAETDRSGLGLYITKKIMEKHGGSIHIDSKKGEGTKVQLAFPIHTRQ